MRFVIRICYLHMHSVGWLADCFVVCFHSKSTANGNSQDTNQTTDETKRKGKKNIMNYDVIMISVFLILSIQRKTKKKK